MKRQISKKKRIVRWVLFGMALALIAWVNCCTYVSDVRFSDPHYFERYLHRRGYERALGVQSIYAVEEDYGVPERTAEAYDAENDRTFVTLYYDSRGIEVRCVGMGDLTGGRYDLFGYDIRTVAVHILSDQYRFGRADIGLGSTREAVQEAYLPEKSTKNAFTDYPPFYEGIDEAYRGDDHARIMFCYDENGVVERMVIDPSRFG